MAEKLTVVWVERGGVQVQSGKWFRFVGERAGITVAEAAQLLGVTPVTVWRWINNGELSCMQPEKRSTRTAAEILVCDVRKYANEHGLFIGTPVARRVK